MFDSVYVIDAYAAYVQWKSMIPRVEFDDKTKVWWPAAWILFSGWWFADCCAWFWFALTNIHAWGFILCSGRLSLVGAIGVKQGYMYCRAFYIAFSCGWNELWYLLVLFSIRWRTVPSRQTSGVTIHHTDAANCIITCGFDCQHSVACLCVCVSPTQQHSTLLTYSTKNVMPWAWRH